MIALIAAIDQHRVMGQGNSLPWHLPADLKHFKKITMGKPVIMGRRTFESIGRPLSGRMNIILSKQPHFHTDDSDVRICHTLHEALCNLQDMTEIMVIGGAEVFKQALPIASKMYLTILEHAFQGDVFFPEWDQKQWTIVSKEAHVSEDKHAYPYSFLELHRCGQPVMLEA